MGVNGNQKKDIYSLATKKQMKGEQNMYNSMIDLLVDMSMKHKISKEQFSVILEIIYMIFAEELTDSDSFDTIVNLLNK